MATVNQLQTAANMVYGDGSGPKTLGAGWQQINGIAIATYARNGYQGAAWFNPSTGEVIIANGGTQPINLANLQSDVGITLQPPKICATPQIQRIGTAVDKAEHVTVVQFLAWRRFRRYMRNHSWHSLKRFCKLVSRINFTSLN